MGAFLSDLSVPSLLVTTVLLCVCLYLWVFTRWHYWERRGVPYLKPVIPLVGSMYDILLLKSLPDITNRIYKETKGLPFVGIYAFHTPVLFVRDLELCAKILVKDFHHFEDRGFHHNVGDSLGRNLIHQDGPDWRFSRSKLAPCFNVTKVKSMLATMKAKGEVLADRLEQEQARNGVVQTWDIMLRYTTDVVTLCTYGVESNSLQKKEEQFRDAGRHILGLHFIYHVFTGSFFPRLHKLLGISVAKTRVKNFFHDVTQQVIKYRKDNESDKIDVFHALLQLKADCSLSTVEKHIPEIDENFVTAQAFGFFFAGFETPGNILACTLYEVAKHPQIQARLYTEISNVLSRDKGEVTFEGLQDMKYLRQVISEALRKYAPLTLIFRRCTKDYPIPGTSTVVEKGTLVLIPMRSFHDDPDYYPHPELFNPERFSEEETAARHIAAYMPFGVGPRFCPAVLYSHIKMRTAMVYILRRFQVCCSPESPSCIEASAVDFLFTPKDGVPLVFKKRES